VGPDTELTAQVEGLAVVASRLREPALAMLDAGQAGYRAQLTEPVAAVPAQAERLPVVAGRLAVAGLPQGHPA
jgi:hypothetical protein